MKPLWRRAFDAAERAVAPMLQDATASEEFAEFMRVSVKSMRELGRISEAASRQWLHLWNLPAAGDVAALKKKLGSLEAEVRSLRTALENERGGQVATLTVAS